MAWNESFERARARLSQRAFAYRAVFVMSDPRVPLVDTAPWWAFWRTARSSELSAGGELVLRDLARYCYAGKSTLKVSQVDQHVDPLAMAFAEGRRDVFNRITAMLELDAPTIGRIAHARTSDE
jgi:hypothetical protein